jgi:hypothetical protein
VWRSAPTSNPLPWSDSSEAWRYASGKVWTGEAFQYARRIQPEYKADLSSSQQQLAAISQTSVSERERPEIAWSLGEPQQTGVPSYSQGTQGYCHGKNKPLSSRPSILSLPALMYISLAQFPGSKASVAHTLQRHTAAVAAPH